VKETEIEIPKYRNDIEVNIENMCLTDL
jgi:hypothetical protein